VQHFEGYDAEGYSMWFLDYKYPEENTVNFIVMNKVPPPPFPFLLLTLKSALDALLQCAAAPIAMRIQCKEQVSLIVSSSLVINYRRTSISGTTFSGNKCLSGTSFHAI
jgi:hypothetical protein